MWCGLALGWRWKTPSNQHLIISRLCSNEGEPRHAWLMIDNYGRGVCVGVCVYGMTSGLGAGVVAHQNQHNTNQAACKSMPKTHTPPYQYMGKHNQCMGGRFAFVFVFEMQHVIHCPSSASVTALLCNTMAHINAGVSSKGWSVLRGRMVGRWVWVKTEKLRILTIPKKLSQNSPLKTQLKSITKVLFSQELKLCPGNG